MKQCSRCQQPKPLEAYAAKANALDGRQAWCRECSSAQKAEWIKTNRDKVRWNTLWTRYRVRQEDWDRMLRSQDDVCLYCREKPPVAVDHDHSCCPGARSCGRCVRGLACTRCNALMAFIENNADTVSRMLTLSRGPVDKLDNVA